jgi:hypothetical protein
LANLQYLSSSQIAGLHFPNERKSRRRLRALHEVGYLKRFERPNLEAVGRGEYIYSLSTKGCKTYGEEPVAKRRRKSLLTVEHHLLLNDFRISLGQSCSNSEFSCEFIAEYDRCECSADKLAKRTTDCVVVPETMERVRFTPDGVFSIANQEGKKLLFFLEIDRGTENLSASGNSRSFAERIAAYKHYLDGKGYARYCEEFQFEFRGFRLLVVTTSLQRLEHLKEIAADVDPRGVVWLCLQKDITPETLFGAIWFVAKIGDSDLHSIVSKDTVKVSRKVGRWSEHCAPGNPTQQQVSQDVAGRI